MCSPWQLVFLIPCFLTSATAFVHLDPKQTVVQQDGVSYRLPNETFPVHYAVHLKTNIHEADFRFTGRVEIMLSTRQETSTIVVHARQLVIDQVRLWNTLSPPTEIRVLPAEYDNVTEFVTVRLVSGALQANQNFMLAIEYTGELRDDNLGFYRSSYRDANNQLV